jgi:hypothetical protein
VVAEAEYFLIIVEFLLGVGKDDWFHLCLEVLKAGLVVRE